MEGEGEEEMEVVVGDKGGLRRYVDDGRDYIGIAIKTPTSISFNHQIHIISSTSPTQFYRINKTPRTRCRQ